MTHKAVVLFSGGIDSAVLAWHLRQQSYEVSLLSVNYGQRHHRELAAASSLATAGDFPWQLLHLPELRQVLASSCLTDARQAIPDAPPADPLQQATVVPGRNLLLLSLACACAARQGAEEVACGATATDAAIYRDCRASFLRAARDAAELSMGITIRAPFVHRSKADVVRLGRELGVPLDLCWSCYAGGEAPCGACGACQARKEAGA